jgi:hypothetical protein
VSRLIVPVILAALTWSACGGGGGSSSTSNLVTPPGTGGGSSNTGGAIVDPTLVTPAPGGTVSGVDIIVPSGASALNVTVLGTADPGASGGTASSTGDVIHQGSTRRVLIFGTGLSAADVITISGPGDITITGQQSITSTSGKSGLQFLATVDPNAALGARTVRIRNGNNISTFTGGLEVVP